MIIKTLSNRSGPSRLVKYLFKEEKVITKSNQKPLVIKHNLRSRSVNGYIKEFEENEKNRVFRRADSVLLYHTVLSFHVLDSSSLNEAMLKDLTKQFISLRGTSNMYLASVHFDKAHVHIHIAQSGVSLSGKAARISKADFAKLKKDLTEYQKEKYPELSNSLPEHGKTKQHNMKKGQEKNIKNERSSDKNSLLKYLDEAFHQSFSRSQFMATLQLAGHDVYYRNGKMQGILSNDKKYRFSNLGYDKEKLQQLDDREKDIFKHAEKWNRDKTKELEELVGTDHEEEALQQLEDLRGGRDREEEREISETRSQYLEEDEREQELEQDMDAGRDRD